MSGVRPSSGVQVLGYFVREEAPSPAQIVAEEWGKLERGALISQKVRKRLELLAQETMVLFDGTLGGEGAVRRTVRTAIVQIVHCDKNHRLEPVQHPNPSIPGLGPLPKPRVGVMERG